MEYLLTIIRPKIGVFLNALAVHSEQFDKLVKETDPKQRQEKIKDLIAQEKGKLISQLPADGWAVLNKNDARVARFRQQTKAQVVWFDKVEVKLNRQLTDENTQSSLAAAITVGQAMGIEKQKAVKTLEQDYRLPPGRMSLFKGIKKTTIIDSSYNASTKPMLGALTMLSQFKGKKIALLGDMREMGLEAKAEHEAVAEKAVKTADMIVTVGPLMKEYLVPKAIKLGFGRKKIYSLDNSYRALEKVKELIKGGETILVKGSQNTLFLEIVVEGLLKDKKETDQLCRRGKFWDKKREEIKTS